MITAAEALRLPRARLTDDEIAQAKVAMELIRQHILDTMTFAGLPSLDIPVLHLESGNAAKAICIWLSQQNRQWEINATLMAEPPLFKGAPAKPHHWTFQIRPKVEAYDEIDFTQLSLSLV